MVKEIAIKKCLEARKLAIARRTYVGACIWTDTDYYIGFNIENRSHKGYHAEEVAILNCYLNKVKPSSIKGMVISFGGDEDKPTFPCGHCRQAIWQYTGNPDILLVEVSIESGKILGEKTVGELLPYPYPHKENEGFIHRYRFKDIKITEEEFRKLK